MAFRLGREKAGPLHDYGLSITLAIMFAVSWLAQGIFQWFHEAQQAEEHGQALDWGSFLPAFGTSTFENWQSEWLQLVFQAILLLGAKHWLFKVDAEDMERIEAKIDSIKDRLDIPASPTPN